jgi:hypothetical protein
MTYNTTRRRRFTPDQRKAFLIAHGCKCYWCLEPIAEDEPFDIEHVIARELMEGKDADADDNLRPIHTHPKPCHKSKTALDRKLIAKSNRIRRQANPETRRTTRHPIRSRKAAWPKRPFPKRQK